MAKRSRRLSDMRSISSASRRKGRGVRGPIETSSNTNWVGFGADLISVADAIVADVRDGIVDNPPLLVLPPPSSMELAGVGGNYVVLDLGRSRYVHYAHLENGSVAVRRGQRVHIGQLLGRLGNSGSTNGAHLHFNVVDGLLLREAQGLPYLFDAVVSRGTTTADAALGDASMLPELAGNARRALPLNDAMVEFPRDL
jgi:hypothetical protein